MPLRMLVITQNFPQRLRSWMGEFLIRQARFLLERGIETSFITPRPWAPWPLSELDRWRIYSHHNPNLELEEFEARVVHYVRPPGTPFFRFESLAMRAAVLPLARRWHRSQPFDLVLGVQMNGEGGAAVHVGRKLSIPSAAMAIGTDVRVLPERVRGLEKTLHRTISEVDLPIAVSYEIAERLRRLGRCKVDPFVIRLPRDTALFKPAEDRGAARAAMGIAPDECAFVFVGRLEAAKGMAELCEAASRLVPRFPQMRLICLGDGLYREQIVEQGGGEARVIAPGRVDPVDVPGYLQAADVFVLPSHSEGLPQAMLEAMNCGLPAIATDVGGTSEALVDGETGILIPARDAAALEAAMARMISEPVLRRRMGAAGLELAARSFDPERESDRFAEAIRALVARHRS